MPAYLALSTDISGSKISGAANIGKTIYLTDTNSWLIINKDLTVSPFQINMNSTICGSSISIDAVALKDTTTDARAKIVAGTSIVGTDVALAVHDANPISGSMNILNFPTTYSGSITNFPTSIDSVIYDTSGCAIESHTDADGQKYLGVAAIQAVHADTNNSSTTNLDSTNSYTFTGSPTSTLGIVGLQWNLKTDQNATVYIEQSDDGTNWDISDSFAYYYSKGAMGNTVQAITGYWRVRVILTGTTDTTYFRLASYLCPIADPLPRSLNSYGRLSVSSGIEDLETGARVEVDPLGSLKTITPVRLVGTAFSGSTLDTNFWTAVATGTGSASQAGELTVSTGTTANSTIKVTSVRKARKVTGAANQFRCVARLVTAPQANNIRRAGAYDDNNGYFFQVDGTTFGVGYRRAGVDTIVTSGSFNGNFGKEVAIDTLMKRIVINISEVSAKYFVNDILLHTITDVSGLQSPQTLDLQARVENINSGGNTTDNSILIKVLTILRLGELTTLPQYFYSGTNATTVLKYSAGTLQKVINLDNTGTFTIYDSVSATGTQIAVIDASKVVGEMEFNAPFSNGLTVVNNGAKCTLIYE